MYSGYAYMGVKKYEQALESYLQARFLIQEDSNSELSFRIAKALEKLHRYDEAIEAYIHAAADSLNSKYPEASMNAGLCYHRKREYERAIEQYDKAIADSPGGIYPEGYYLKGMAYYMLNDMETADREFNTAAKISPAGVYARATAGKAKIAVNTGQLIDGIATYRLAIAQSFDKNFPLASLGLGMALTEVKEYSAAMKELERVLEGTEEDLYSSAWNEKGVALDKLGKKDEALYCFEQAIDSAWKKRNPVGWLNKAKILFEQKKIKDADAAALKSLQQNNKFYDAVLFVYERSKMKVYKNRLDYLCISNVDYQLTLKKWSNVQITINNTANSKESELYTLLLLEKEDILHTSLKYCERLRLAYLVAATNTNFATVYYILDGLLQNQAGYVLDAMDYYFYLNAAFEVAASKEELDRLIQASGLSGTSLTLVNDYLFQPARPLQKNGLIELARNETEKTLLSDFYLQNKAYTPTLSLNTLKLYCVTQSFSVEEGKIEALPKGETHFDNLRDSVNERPINERRVADNIDKFVDGLLPQQPGICIYLLTKAEALFDPDYVTLERLKGYALVKYEQRKNKLHKKPEGAILLARSLLSTAIGVVAAPILGSSYLVCSGLTMAIDFCLNIAEDQIDFSKDIKWDQFVENTKGNGKLLW
jgi:tetratricopeptide (TPR) repeat protein